MADRHDREITDAVHRLRADQARLETEEIGLSYVPDSEPHLDLYAFQVGVGLTRRTPPFASLIFAALHGADSANARVLRAAFPRICGDGQLRYDAPGGLLPGEPGYDETQALRRLTMDPPDDYDPGDVHP